MMITLPAALAAQADEWDDMLEELAESYLEDAGDEEEWALQMEELTEWHEHPLDLNTATRQELLRLPFLESKDVDAIIDYRTLNGPFRSLGELRLISSLDAGQVKWMRLCSYLNPGFQPAASPDTASFFKIRRHEILARTDVPLYQRAGWPWARGIANICRYTLSGTHWEAGLRAEKDAGEPMFTRESPLWDAWGGYVMARDLTVGKGITLKTVLLGDFKATFAEGLVMNTGFRFGKQQSNLWRTAAALRPHRSAEESRFLRGGAATIGMGKAWELTALYSFRHLDATIQKDNTVRAINQTGLHRTDSERARCGTLGSHTTALHATWQHRTWRAGATAMYQAYDHVFAQGTALYRQIYPEGYQFGAASVDYALRTAHYALSGETAYNFSGQGGGLATLNKAVWRPSNDFQLSAIQRFYSKNYFSAHASAFGENSNVQNESGICLLAEASRLGPFALRALFDYFYSPWPRFTMSRYSTGFEGTLQTTWQPTPQHQLTLRYAIKSKERSDRRHYSHRLRATYHWQCSPAWTTTATAFITHYAEPTTQSHSTGVALMPRADYTCLHRRLRLTMAALLFSTDDYDSRLYFYEPTLLQAFGMQMLDGKGERLMAMLRWQHSRHFLLQLKAAVTHYRDRDTQSSGPTLINSPWKPDFQLLMRYNFK